MKKILLFSAMFLLLLGLGSCREEGGKDEVGSEASEGTTVKKEPTEVDKKIHQSVVSKVMVTPELKTFSSALVSAEMINFLVTEKGPFTVFAPSNEAFAALNANDKQILNRPERKNDMVNLLKSHILPKQMNSATLVQELKGKERLELTTLSGAVLFVTKREMDLVISDAEGNEASLKKTDIVSENGVVHVLDKVLNLK